MALADEHSAKTTVALPHVAVDPRQALPPRFQEELDAFIRSAGFHDFTVAHEVKAYGDEESGQSWESHVFSIAAPHADRPERTRLMSELLDYVGDHADERIRKTVTIRVR